MPASAQRTGLDDVQVVINTYGRDAWYAGRAIASILRQQHRPGRIHLIDQNSVPLTLAPEFQAEPSLVVHRRPDARGARARNTLLEFPAAGWIAFLDDDAHWIDGYSERLIALLENDPGLDLIAGAVLDETTGAYYSARHRLGGDLARFTGSKLLSGANFLVRASTFAAVGGYDIRFGPGTAWPSSEEADLCWRILRSGARARYVRELAARHPPMHVPDAREAARKGNRYGYAKGVLAAIWLFERHHRYGLLEFLEMSVVPIAKGLRAILHADASQVRIQASIFLGRQHGFWTRAFTRGRT